MPPKRSLLILLAIVAVAYGLWTIRSGIHTAIDTQTYSRWADLLIAADFNVAAYLRENSFVASPIFYLLWIAVVALLKTALGSWWMAGVVALNWIALTIGAYMTLDAIRRITQSAAGMLLAALLFLSAADLLIFVPYVLSDLLFWALSTSVLALGVALVITEAGDDDRSMRTVVTGSVLVVLALLFRPVALPLAAFWLMAIATRVSRPLIDRFAPSLLIAAAVGAAAAIVTHAYVLVHPSAWPFGKLPAVLTLVAQEYREGMFVHQSSPPMLVTPATDVFGFIRMTLQKLLFFITPWLPHYSTAHTLLNLAFFVPAYSLSITAIRSLRRLAPPQQRAATLLAVFVLLVAVFHSLLLIDSDHRYRVPVVPALIMLSAIGLESARRPQTLASIARTK